MVWGFFAIFSECRTGVFFKKKKKANKDGMSKAGKISRADLLNLPPIQGDLGQPGDPEASGAGDEPWEVCRV